MKANANPVNERKDEKPSERSVCPWWSTAVPVTKGNLDEVYDGRLLPNGAMSKNEGTCGSTCTLRFAVGQSVSGEIITLLTRCKASWASIA
ncbi:hypothetical protein GALMADRAFT_245833 [Galerina marginata CBS 339.88]|uniref:Uncharacterized protein n=1 Tax=Galerina marginata (strain CBS 339.88) TaxID=685588 RepID=A0A067T3D9_GALM3|nr:hypothetical protein GALMADRAFT_245833 [Galerina marginata CBS 339.88]